MRDAASTCPICCSRVTAFIFEKRYEGKNIEHSGIANMVLKFQRCRSCGVVFMVPLSEEGSHAALAWYEELYHQSSHADSPHHPVNQARYREWLRALGSYRSTGKLFETGFGRGEFLLTALQDGWGCSGNEVSPNACQSIRRFGVQAHCGDIAAVEGHGDQDVVASLGVIEHVKDPHVQFRYYARLLRPGGAAFITTPNYNSLSRVFLRANCRIFDVEHLFYFTPKTIARLLRDAGFGRVTCWTKNINLPELLNGFRPHKQSREGVDAGNQDLRKTIESSGSLKRLKGLVNRFIRAAGIGEELYVIAVKSGPS